MKSRALRIAVAAAILALAAVPSFAARGNADFTRYVALGDSLTAGYTNSSLLVTHQVHSYPAVIAERAHAGDFQQPLISEPGIPAELKLISISPLMIAPKSTTNGQPMNLTLPRPYNNLGIPGARAADLLTQTGAAASSNPYYQIILRKIAPAVDQALALHPTFVSVWIGNNDVLGAVLAGTPAVLTPKADFETAYTAILDKLIAGAPSAGMVTANIPAVTSIPFAATIPPVIINPATNQPLLVGGNPVFLFADLGGGTLGQLGPGSLVTLGAASFLATGYGIPPALAPNFPTLPNAGKPLPDAVTLTASEVQAISTRAAELNEVIGRVAAARDIPVVDMAAAMTRYKAGVNIAGVTLTTAFLTGGIFGFDGVHPNDIGYTLVANEFIRTINRAYDEKIPLASIYKFFTTDTPVEFSVDPADVMNVQFAPMSWDMLLTTFVNDDPVPSVPRRGRPVGTH